MNNKEKLLAIVSAACLFVATIGFLLVAWFYDGAIADTQTKLSTIVKHQEYTANDMDIANRYIESSFLLEDHLQLARSLRLDVSYITKRTKTLLSAYRYSAMHSINAAVSARQLDNEAAQRALTMMDAATGTDALRDIYRKYMALASTGTLTLAKDYERLQQLSARKKWQKEIAWYLCFAFQSVGLIFGIAAIVLKTVAPPQSQSNQAKEPAVATEEREGPIPG